jgi:hypothetical protein
MGRTKYFNWYLQAASGGSSSYRLSQPQWGPTGRPTVHGGPDKAVYAYDTDHYVYWRNEINQDDCTPGLFGET